MNFADNPAISVPPDNVVTRETGEQVAFSIEVNKNTPAMVKWFFNGASLSSNGRVEIANENNEDFAINKVWTQDLDASFHINNITCYDIGFYQVEISNPAETVLLTYELIVENCKYCYEYITGFLIRFLVYAKLAEFKL